MREVRAMSTRDIEAMYRVIKEESEERQRQAELAELKARKGGR